MKKLLTKSILVILTSASFVACKKETVTEPQREAETVVTKGPGENEFTQRGPNGSTVIYSSWINKSESDWSGIGTIEILTSLTAPSLSDDIVNKGVVLVYFDHFGTIKPMPNVWLEGVNSMVMDFSFVKQKITLKLRTGGTSITGIVDIPFRYVLIPGTNSGGRMNVPVDYNDYNAVCSYYGIAR